MCPTPEVQLTFHPSGQLDQGSAARIKASGTSFAQERLGGIALSIYRLAAGGFCNLMPTMAFVPGSGMVSSPCSEKRIGTDLHSATNCMLETGDPTSCGKIFIYLFMFVPHFSGTIAPVIIM